MLIALPEYDNNVFGALVSSGHLCEAEAPTEPTGETQPSDISGVLPILDRGQANESTC